MRIADTVSPGLFHPYGIAFADDHTLFISSQNSNVVTRFVFKPDGAPGEENNTPVVGIREGAWLVCENGAVVLKGQAGARIFRRGEAPVETKPGDNIVDLVGGPDAE